jgi:hypothetical protein
MTADLSRVRFDPLRDHSGIGSMQGRVWLDADFNEQVAITDRRLRAQVVDLAPATSIVSRLTPGAFKITAQDGEISIGAGRMYVDGLLAENHGSKIGLEPTLAEPNGSDAIKYGDQPYRKGAADVPKTGGQHLFYLVVWQRELDYLNTPDLVEPAIGVETTTRTQTVWQVGVLPDVGTGKSCDSDIPKWTELVAPSSALLTTGTDETAPPSGPCDVPPSKGYRGPENQLYRVELHSETQFKWSRDNATVISAVDKTISTSRLRLATLGRDEILSIRSGDWVEILDDKRELDRKPGEMRKVTVEEDDVILLDSALPGDLANSTAHLRVRKWDSGPTTILGGGKAQLLEHGITVAFTFAAKGKPRPGDYWVFAARVADASVEKLTAAPPRGIHLHWAKLALVTIGGPVTDCRPAWPSDTDGCECEVCVAPGDSLQEAIETLKKRGGGTLTLCPGTYPLDAPLKLDGAKSVRIRGTGQRSRIVTRHAGIVVTRSQDVVLEGFAIDSDGDAPTIAFGLANNACRIERLTLRHSAGAAIAMTGAQQFLTIHDCFLNAKVGITAQSFGRDSKGLLTLGLSIKDNVLACADRGIDLGIDRHGVIQHIGLTAITGNHIGFCADSGIVVTGLVPQDVPDMDGQLDISGNLLEVNGSGIVTGGRVRVSENTVIAAGKVEGSQGISLIAAPPDTPNGVAQVLGNKVSGFGGSGIVVSARLASLLVKQNMVRECAGGILVQPATAGGRVAVDNNQVLDLHPWVANPVVEARPLGSIALSNIRTGPAAEMVSRILAGPARTASGVSAGSAGPVRTASGFSAGSAPIEAEATVVLGRGTAGSTATTGATGAASGADTVAIGAPNMIGNFLGFSTILGIGVMGAGTALIMGNTVDGVGAGGADASRHAYGIMAGAFVDAKIVDNLVARVGSVGSGGSGLGIACFTWQNTASIGQNTVRGEVEAPARPAWMPVFLQGTTTQGLVFARSARTPAGVLVDTVTSVYLIPETVANVELTGNTLHGGTEEPVLTVQTAGEVILTGNRGVQPGHAGREVARIHSAAAVAQGNRFKGGEPSLIISTRDGAVVIGNLTSGGVQVNGNALPHDNLNPLG